jgi:hypothetical protein
MPSMVTDARSDADAVDLAQLLGERAAPTSPTVSADW